MLMVDLDRLGRERRLVVEAAMDVSAPGWEVDAGRLVRLDVRIEAQRAGADVVALGEVVGEARLTCRRCLTEITVPLRESLALAYQPGLDAAEAERREVYPLPARSRELDLTDAVREHVLLATPRFVLCQESCRGLCSRCGANLNATACACGAMDTDPRWGPLRKAQ